MGYFVKDCSKFNKWEIKVNLVKQEDEGLGFFMVEVCDFVETVVVKLIRKVLFYEKNVIFKLSGDYNVSWYFDTGVSNYMTGCKEKFFELEYDVEGSVKFGDGSAVEICG